MKRLFAVASVLSLVSTIVGQEAPVQKKAPLAMLSIVVTDSRGNHVHSLSSDDFHVSIGGTPLDIEAFSERGAPGAPMGEVRRIAIVFDTTTLSPGARRQALESVHAFLAKTLRPGDLASVLATGNALRAATGWTGDLKDIDAALQLIASDATTPVRNSQADIEKRIREIATDIQQSGARPGRPSQTLYTFDALMDAARNYAAAAYNEAEQNLSVISSAVTLFTPGTRNVLIVVGGGVPRIPGAGVFQYVESLRANAQRGVMGGELQSGAQGSSPLGEASSYDLTPVFNTLGTRAWRRGVTFYGITSDVGDESRQIDSQQSSDALAAFTNSANRVAGYYLLADETSGLALVGRSPAAAFDQVAADLDSSYVVGVHPTALISGKHAISVKVRNGYRARISRGSIGSGTVADEMESRVIANQILKPSENPMGISLSAAPPVAEGERRLVTVDVLIPVQSLKLVPQGDSVTGSFTVFIATGDAFGHSSNVTRQTKEIRWPADALVRAGDRPLTFRVKVMLEPGRSQISVGVIDEQSKRKGFSRLTV